MGIQNIHSNTEDREFITNQDIVTAAHGLLGGIDLDPASSEFANTHVCAGEIYTPSDDGLNCQPWYGKVYLFPPAGAYFWDKKRQRWKMTRASSPSLMSSHAVWFNRLYKEWLAGEVTEGLFFTNVPDMIRYDPRIFKFPLCILKTPPTLLKRTSEGLTKHKTCTSLIVYMPPKNDTADFIEKFISIYEEKGHILS